MAEQSAEEAAHARARAVVENDFGTTVRFTTPEALAKGMEIGRGIMSLRYDSYEVKAQRSDGDDYIFDITYYGPEQTLTLSDRFRNIDGEWRLVDIERLG